MSIARFKVDRVHIDGSTEATITIDRDSLYQMVEVRPKGKHYTFTMPLGQVAEIIHQQHAKKIAEEKVLSRKTRRRR